MLFSDKKCDWTFLKLAIYLIYTNHLIFWPNTYTRKCDFDLLMELFYPVLRNTILLVIFLTFSDRWTGQYPILAYTTWCDLNQSQPHISIRGIKNIPIYLLFCYNESIIINPQLLSVTYMLFNCFFFHVHLAQIEICNWSECITGMYNFVHFISVNTDSSHYLGIPVYSGNFS